MENLNLVELLKDAPKGLKLYSPLFGECELDKVSSHHIYIRVHINNKEFTKIFYSNGKYYSQGECLLFPAKENQDWSKFQINKESFKVGDYIKRKETGEVYFLKQELKSGGAFWAGTFNSHIESCDLYVSLEDLEKEYEKVEKFNPKWLKPFDRILVRENSNSVWYANFFSHTFNEDEPHPYAAIDALYKYCIPFNEKTKHLVGTKNDAPEFYKI